ncbi:MAG: 4'-phosphopantetheinyl transferase superfamily protein [Catalinimonas sp.]
MPITLEDTAAGWALWELREPEESLRDRLAWTDRLRAEYRAISHPTKRHEWLGARVVAFELAHRADLRPTDLLKDNHGKPEWLGAASGVSLTHAFPYVAAQVGRQRAGIDLEPVRSKLAALAPRFMGADERADLPTDLLTLAICWSAKEAVYKWYGRQGLSFRDHLRARPFKIFDNRGSLEVSVRSAERRETLGVCFRTWPGYVLTWVEGARLSQ